MRFAKQSNLNWPGRTLVFAVLAWLFAGFAASAHEPSKSFLSLKFESGRLIGQWDVPLNDLRKVVPQPDSGFANAELYLWSHLEIKIDGRTTTLRASREPVSEQLSDGEYVQFTFVVDDAARPQTASVTYTAFFETNSLHRGLLRVESDGKTQVAAFSPEHVSQQFQLATPARQAQFFDFVREGVWHIWTGYDHILFLLALLLPSVLRREADGWRPVEAMRPAFFNVLKIVTAFTLAHSLTLSLAALGIVRLPSRLTESAIALSVVLAALNNLRPMVRERGWMLAFGFGLIHGFGFATALSDLGLVRGAMAVTLIGFNLGVEIGQLAIVAVFLPAAFALRRTWLYREPLINFGSAGIGMIAAAWCAERVLNLRFMPF